MLRFFLAGLLTVGALVLLFIGSFGDPMGTLQDLGATLSITSPAVHQAPSPLRQVEQPVPVTQPPTAAPPQMQAQQPASPAVTSPPVQPSGADAAHDRDALAQQLNEMRDQLATATQQVTALRAQADQEQQDLQRLQQQRTTAEQTSNQAEQGNADEAAARARRADDIAKQVADQQATLQRLQAQSQQATAAGKQQQAALQQQIAAQQAQLDRLKTDTAQAEAQHQRQLAEASTHPAPPKAEAAPPAHAQPREQASPPATQPAPAKTASASPKPVATAKPAAPDDREQVLQRLRHESGGRPNTSHQSPAAQTPTETAAQPAPPQPVGPPPQERLLEARNAAAAGRIDEARHLLQQAQVQLVLRPVSPWQTTPVGGRVAAGQVAEALSMLDAGDLPHAIQYINLAVAQADWPREITASSASPTGQGAYYPR